MKDLIMTTSLTLFNSNDAIFNEIPVLQANCSDGTIVRYCNLWDVYKFLEIKRDRTSWAKDIIRNYDLVEGSDYVVKRPKNEEASVQGLQRSHDYFCSVQVAKEICMVSKTIKGRLARRYFIYQESLVQEMSKQEELKQHYSLLAETKRQLQIETDRANHNCEVAIRLQQEVGIYQRKEIAQLKEDNARKDAKILEQSNKTKNDFAEIITENSKLRGAVIKLKMAQGNNVKH